MNDLTYFNELIVSVIKRWKHDARDGAILRGVSNVREERGTCAPLLQILGEHMAGRINGRLTTQRNACSPVRAPADC